MLHRGLNKLTRLAQGLALASMLSACSTVGLNQLAAPASVDSGRSYYFPPEYDPVQGMLISDHLAEFPNGKAFLSALLNAGAEVWLLSANQELLQQTRTVLSEKFDLQDDQMSQLKALPVATETVWARDWAPLFAYSATQSGEVGMVDYEYYSDRPLDDGVPAALSKYFAASGPEPGVHLSNLPVNVELEGGNVLCTRKNCFVSQEVLRRIEVKTSHTGDPVAIKAQLEKYIRQDFTIVPRLPAESTGHIDIWAKLLNDKTLIVGQISQAGLDAVPDSLKATYTSVRDFLEEQATGVDAQGQPSPNSLAAVIKRLEPEIQIVRIPMPTPGIYQGIETFRTYTNSFLYNGTAVVPRYSGNTVQDGTPTSAAARAQRDLLLDQEQQVEKIYQNAGYKVEWVRADNLIRDGGAWHCVAMQIPKLAKN